MKTRISLFSKITFIIVLTFALSSVSAQSIKVSKVSSKTKGASWVELMQDTTINFYTVQDAFYNSKQSKIFDKAIKEESRIKASGKKEKSEDESKIESVSIYKRWENYMKPRVYPTGVRPAQDIVAKEYDKFVKAYPLVSTTKSAKGTWTLVGPNGAPGGSVANGSYQSPAGAGRVNCIRFNPLRSQSMWIGTPCGGAWRSYNGGTTWIPASDNTLSMGVSDIAVASDTNIIYMATGDADAGDSYSIGILKSTDAGFTWQATSFTCGVSSGIRIYKLLSYPGNSDIIYAATNAGLYKTTDGFATYTRIGSATIGKCTDVEFKPGTPSTVYAAGANIWYSTNDGSTWTACSGLTTTELQRIAIAVSPNAPNNVYALLSRTGVSPNYTDQGGFYGLYKSTDNGATFTMTYSYVTANHNLLGWSTTFNDQGGQGWYDLSLAVNPSNANEMFIGGVNLQKSTNGGTSWTCNAYWLSGAGFQYTHADHHAVEYLPGSSTTLFDGDDGGIFKSTNNGTSWSDLSGTLAIGQIAAIGASQQNIIMSGWQDNGSNIDNSGAWTIVKGGDGCEAIVDPTNTAILYSSYVNGTIYRSSNSGGSWTTIAAPGINGITGTEVGDWITPFVLHPTTNTTLYAGYTNLWRSTNSGTSWTKLGTLYKATGESVLRIAVAPSAPTTIYVIKLDTIFKTTNDGGVWTNITGTLKGYAFTDIVVKNSDANTVWVTVSGYNNGSKVFKSTDGGTTWTNYSSNLPNIPFNAIIADKTNASDGVYVGADMGIYYRDNLMPNWTLFNSGLPNAVIKELEIYYDATPANSKLRAGTYGRGLWQSDLYTRPDIAPVAGINSDKTALNACTGYVVNFQDGSDNVPTSWSWSFPGGTPSSSILQNPSVTYPSTPGTYSVSLTATNSKGSGSVTKTNYIIVGDKTAPLEEDFSSTTFPPVQWTNAIWMRSTATGANGISGGAAMFNCFNLAANSTGNLITMNVDLTGVSTPVLKFNVAYRQYTTEADQLQVFVSTNCGSSWSAALYNKSGSTLATVTPAAQVNFAPAAAGNWRAENISLAAYANQKIMIKFIGTSQYGNNIWVDDVFVGENTCSVGAAGAITGSATICQGTSGITYSVPAITNATGYVWTLPTGATIASGSNTRTITVDYSQTATSGNITVKGTAACGSGTSSALGITVNQLPATALPIVGPDVCSLPQTDLVYEIPYITNYTIGQTGYVWSVPSGATITSGSNTNQITVNFSAGATAGDIIVYGQNGCGSGNPSPALRITMGVPTTPGTITGYTNVCKGDNEVPYSVSAVPGADSYVWSLPTGATLASGSGTNSITVDFSSSAVSGNISVYPVNTCGNGPVSQLFPITASVLPSQPSVIAGPASPCQGATLQNYNVTNVAGVNYTWTVPGDWSITSGQGTNSINVTIGTNSGNITVTPSNVCGNGTVRSLAVTTTTVPAQPSVITGPVSPCQGSTLQTYSVTNVAGVTYTWTVPGDWSITSGQGTNNINVTVGTNNGNVIAIPSNSCGNGTSRSLAVTATATPAQPSVITGPSAPCQGATLQNYSVTNVAGVTYTWTVPNDWSITSGQGTNSINVTAGTNSGNVTVTPSVSSCSGTQRLLAVSTTASPSQPSAITGPASPCQGATLQNYSVTSVAGVTYTWTVPSDWNITSGQGTNSIIVTIGNNSGSVDVTPSLGSCSGSSRSLTVTTLSMPAQPSVIAGTPSQCQGTTLQNYTVTNLSGITYTWAVPGDWIITSGQGSNSISVTVGSNNGSISVTPGNTCFSGAASTLAVTSLPVPSQPSAITGAASQCQGATLQNYSVTNVGGISYNWTVPGDWSITSGQGTNSINVTVGVNSGIVQVTPNNGSCNGTAQSLSVTTSAVPVITGQPANASTTEGTGTPTFIVTATGTGLTYQWQEYISSWLDISNGGVYTGATSASLVITNPPIGMNGYKYRCIVTGMCAPVATSDGNATLTVNTAMTGIVSTATGGVWGTGSTWVGGVAPTATDNVIIATTGANSVLGNGGGTTYTCKGLTINSGATLTMYRPFTVTTTTSISGTINFGSTNGTSRLMTFTGAVTLNNGAVWNETTSGAAATFSFGNNFSNNASTFTAQNTSHNFIGSGSTLSGNTTTAIPTATFTGNYTNNGTFSSSTLLTVTGAAIRLTNNGIITASTALSGTGGVIQGATGVLNIGGTSGITTIDASTNPGNTVNYTGAAQTGKVIAYSNLTLSGSGAKTFATTPTINGILSMEGTASVVVTGAGVVTYGTNATLQYNKPAAYTATAEEWITPFAATGGVIIANTGEITLNSVKELNTSIPLTINTGAKLNTSSANNYQLTFGGNFVNNGGTFTANASPIIITNTMLTQSIDGFTTTGSVSMTKTGGIATFTGNVGGSTLTINGSGGTLDLGSGLTHTFSGDLSLANGTLNGGSSILNENATSATAWNGTGTNFIAGTGTVNFGGAAQTIVTPSTFYNLTLSNAGLKTFTGVPTVNNILSMEGTATVSATPIYGSDATLQYKGSSAQITGNELPAIFSGTGGVIIENANGVSLGNTATINSGLFLISGALTINPLINLTVGGTTELGSAECLIIKSNSAGTGSFIDNGFSGSGTAKVEKYLLNGRWWYLGSPLSNGTSDAFGTVSPDVNIGNRLYYWDEVGKTYVNIASTGVAMPVLRGYSFKSFLGSPLTASFTGALNTGVIGGTSNLTYTAGTSPGFNLVCNPYPSAIDWGKMGAATPGLNQTNLIPTIWYRKDGVFATYNWTSGTGQNTGQQYIPAMQAFWVLTNGSAGGLQLTNASRVHNAQTFYKTTETNVFRMEVTEGIDSDETVVGFYQDAQNIFENYDSEKMFATDDIPQVYSLTSDNIEVAINGQPELIPVEDRVIPVGFKTPVAGNFSMYATNLSGFDQDISVYLEDLQLNVIQDLRQSAVYNFSSGVVDNASRFILHFGNMVTGVSASTDDQASVYSYANSVYVNAPITSNGIVEFYDALGKLVYKQSLEKGLNKIDNLFPQGIYISVVNIDAKEIVQKLIIISQH